MTYVRVWRTQLDVGRLEEYDRFVEEQSKPMFRAQQGFQAVIYSRSGGEVAVLSFWDDQAALDALDVSPTYAHAVASIEATGFLRGESVLDVFEIHAGVIETAARLAGAAA